MREEWYVVPARYALKLREVVDDAPWSRAAEFDALIDGMRAEAVAQQDIRKAHGRGEDGHEPPPPRHLPRLSNGQLKR